MSYIATLPGGAEAHWMLEVVPSRRDVSLVYLQQLAGEVPIDNAVAVLAVLPDGRIAGLTPRIVTADALSTRPRVPTIDAAAAVLRGAESLDLPIRGIPVPRGAPRGPERAQLLSAPGLSTSPIEARLRFRSHPPYLLRALGLDDKVQKLSIYDIDATNVDVGLLP